MVTPHCRLVWNYLPQSRCIKKRTVSLLTPPSSVFDQDVEDEWKMYTFDHEYILWKWNTNLPKYIRTCTFNIAVFVVLTHKANVQDSTQLAVQRLRWVNIFYLDTHLWWYATQGHRLYLEKIFNTSKLQCFRCRLWWPSHLCGGYGARDGRRLACINIKTRHRHCVTTTKTWHFCFYIDVCASVKQIRHNIHLWALEVIILTYFKNMSQAGCHTLLSVCVLSQAKWRLALYSVEIHKSGHHLI